MGHAIRVYARARGISLKSVYEELGMSKAQFFQRLRGGPDDAKMSVEELCKIAELLGVDVAELLNPPLAYAPRDSNPEPADVGFVYISPMADVA